MGPQVSGPVIGHILIIRGELIHCILHDRKGGMGWVPYRSHHLRERVVSKDLLYRDREGFSIKLSRACSSFMQLYRRGEVCIHTGMGMCLSKKSPKYIYNGKKNSR